MPRMLYPYQCEDYVMRDEDDIDRLLTTEEVASILKVDEVTLKRWRMEGRGPDSVKLGKGQSSTTKRAVRQLRCSDL